MQLTDTQAYELIICAKSCSYFARNYIFSNIDALTTTQLKWLERDSSTPGIELLGSKRGSYRTSTMLAKALWTVLFKPTTMVVYMAPKLNMVEDGRRTIQQMYDQLPSFIKPESIATNRNGIRLDNGSSLLTLTAGRNVYRGLSVNLMLLDNSSHMNRDTYNDMMACLLPCLPYSSGVFLEAQ